MPVAIKTPFSSKSWWLGLIGVLSFGYGAQAQVLSDPSFRSQAAQGLALTYNAQFDQAHAWFTRMDSAYPQHPAPAFLLATNRWWQSYMCTSPHYHAYIDSQLQRCLALNQQYLIDSPHQSEYTLFQYLGHALHARLASHRREWFAAANRGRKLLPFLDDCLAYANDEVEFCFAAGIYHYYAETYASSNALVKPFMAFFPDGNITQGIAEMERAVAESNFTRPEAMYYLSYIYLEPYARDPVRAQQISAQLRQEYPQNPWFACEYARVHVHTGFYPQARPVLDRLIQRYEARSHAQTSPVQSTQSTYTTKLAMRAYHYRGLCYLDGQSAFFEAAEDFEASLRYAELCGVEDDHYVAASCFYLGRCREELGQKEAAREAYRQCFAMEGNEGFEDRAEAALLRLGKL